MSTLYFIHLFIFAVNHESKLTQAQSRQIHPKQYISYVVVRVDTNWVHFKVEGITAAICPTQLILVQVRPAPDSWVDDMGEAFTAGDLLKKMKEGVPP